jgi:hypothetical protein
LVQDGLEPEPELTALGVPQTWPFIRTELDRRAVRLIVGFQQAFGKAYLTPPGVPADRVKILRQAFADTLRDPKFLAEAKSVRIDIEPQSGEAIQQSVNDLYRAPTEILERIKEIQAP